MEPMMCEETAVIKEWRRIETDDDGYAYWSMWAGPWEFKVCPIVNLEGVLIPNEFYAEIVWPTGDPLAYWYFATLEEAKEAVVLQFNLILLKWMNAISGGVHNGTTS
jgi:hypothetical protein